MLIHLPVFKYFVLSARTVRKAASEASGRRVQKVGGPSLLELAELALWFGGARPGLS